MGLCKEKCCTNDLETCVCLEKHGVVEEFKSNEYENGSWQSHQVEEEGARMIRTEEIS